MSEDKQKEVVRLYNTEKGYVGKFDGDKKTTYTMREISKMLKLSPSYVNQIVQKYKKVSAGF